MKQPILVSYGAGVDSTALLVGLAERGAYPDAITFADTGGEKPETYQYLFLVDDWLATHGFGRLPSVWVRPAGYELPAFGLPAQREMAVIRVVVNTGKYGTLEKNCLEQATLPSIAYGRKGCSEKYKQRPQHKWARGWPRCVAWWKQKDARGQRRLVRRLIGYNADERRGPGGGIQGYKDDFYEYYYPLREWGWGRAACQEALERAGLPVPVKSACFFCSSSKKHEILALRTHHPELFERALTLERTAVASLKTVKGLGRYFSWEEFAGPGRLELQILPEPIASGCMCVGEVVEGEGIDREDADDDQEDGAHQEAVDG